MKIGARMRSKLGDIDRGLQDPIQMSQPYGSQAHLHSLNILFSMYILLYNAMATNNLGLLSHVHDCNSHDLVKGAIRMCISLPSIKVIV